MTKITGTRSRPVGWIVTIQNRNIHAAHLTGGFAHEIRAPGPPINLPRKINIIKLRVPVMKRPFHTGHFHHFGSEL